MGSTKTVARGLLRGLHLEGSALRVRDVQRARHASRETLAFAADGLPIPPTELRLQVSGWPAPPVEEFLTSGLEAQGIITGTLARNGIDADKLGAILDFGVGCGRVARYFTGLNGQLYGCDYNPALVEWTAKNLPHVTATTNRLNPPLPYGSESFDLIYALSVFTHLTERQQYAWIAELRRVMRRGGLVLFTTHGPSFPRGKFQNPNVAQRIAAGELIVFDADHAGRNTCAVLHPPTWVDANMLNGFERIDYVEGGQGICGGQDIHLARRC